MSNLTEVIREQLMATNPDFQRLREEHLRYAARLEQLSAKAYLSEPEKLEESQLKKLKLRVKDEMEKMVQKARAS